MSQPMKQEGIREGQPFYDEPILARPKALAVSVSQALRISAPAPVVIGHERVRLRWMKRDRNGGLVPR